MSKDLKKDESPVSRVSGVDEEVSKTEGSPVSQVVDNLNPTISDDIAALIATTIKSEVGNIVKQIMAAQAAQIPQPATQQAGQALNPMLQASPILNPNQPPVAAPYVSALKGIQVEPGQDLRHIHPQRIKNWFATVEQRWREQFNKKKSNAALQANMSWTRG